MPPVSAVGTLPPATSGSYEPGRCIDARFPTFRARAADQARAAFTPGTTWPITGHPPGLSREQNEDPRFRCHLCPVDASTTTPNQDQPQPDALERLPGPHLPGSSPVFSLNAHHDGLQPTQHQGGLAPAPEGRRWRADDPPSLAQHRLCDESSTRPLLQRSWHTVWGRLAEQHPGA
jgi:hypothetical protein